jgi:hypothetical protein
MAEFNEIEEDPGMNIREYLDDEGNPAMRFTRSLDEDDYEIVDEEELNPGPSREELEAEVKRQQAELEMAKLKAQGLSKEDLTEILKEVRRGAAAQGQSVPVQQKGESDEEFMEKINSEQYEGKLGQLLKDAVQRWAPQTAAPALQGNFEISKELVESNEELGPIYREYKEEVEAEINKLPMNQRLQIPHIYKRATEEVARRHWKDLRKSGVEELVKVEVEKMRKELGLSSDGKPSSPTSTIFSESTINRPSGNRSPSSGKKRIPKPSGFEQKYADTKGISWPQLYEVLQGNPRLKKQINEGGIPWLR